MELDELRNLWKKQENTFRPHNEEEIAAMLKGRSKSIVSKLKRSVWLELTLTVVAGLGLITYAMTQESSALKNISVAILVVFVGYSAYYIKKLVLLTTYETTGATIRTSLENLINNLSTYLRYYKLSYTILYPAYFLLGVAIGGLEQGQKNLFEILSEGRTILISLLLSIAFYFSSNWLVNWYLTKLYGNHLEKLKRLLHDLQSE